MPVINLKLDGDAAWPELDPAKGGKIVELPDDVVHVAFLDKGTVNGRPVVLFRSDKDGIAYVLQITGSEFQALYSAFRGKYGELE